jgi:hypothetical protein
MQQHAPAGHSAFATPTFSPSPSRPFRPVAWPVLSSTSDLVAIGPSVVIANVAPPPPPSSRRVGRRMHPASNIHPPTWFSFFFRDVRPKLLRRRSAAGTCHVPCIRLSLWPPPSKESSRPVLPTCPQRRHGVLRTRNLLASRARLALGHHVGGGFLTLSDTAAGVCISTY